MAMKKVDAKIVPKTAPTSRQLSATHQVVYRSPRECMLNYFGWPTVARLTDGTLVAGASGFRAGHICPFGMTVLWESKDEGASWSAPEILNNSLIDDRDAGITPLADGGFLVSWFTSDTRFFRSWFTAQDARRILRVTESWRDEDVRRELGSFVRRVAPDGSAGPVVPVPVSAPHGPIRLRDGRLFYLGVPFTRRTEDGTQEFTMTPDSPNLVALASGDDGATWRHLGEIAPATPDGPEHGARSLDEPHAVELPDGRLLGFTRNDREFSVWQSESEDGGHTWTKPHPIVASGSPPHALRHSSGVLILSYGYRREPYGQRVAFSYDDGASWENDWIIRADGPSVDLGYPSSVELSDGSILTVYYQAFPNEACSIMASRWRLPERR